MDRLLFRAKRESVFSRTVAVAERRRRTAAIRRKIDATLGQVVRYCATLPIMVLAFRDNHEAAVTIAPDTIFEIVGRAEDDRFLIARVKGEEFLVFATDLNDRAKAVRNAPAEPLAAATQTAS